MRTSNELPQNHSVAHVMPEITSFRTSPKKRVEVGLLCGCLAAVALYVVLIVVSADEGRAFFEVDVSPLQYTLQQANRSRDHFISSNELQSYLNVSVADLAVGADDVVFIVMASSSQSYRVETQRASWMRWAKHLIVLADAADEALGIMTLPEIANKDGFAEAQWRQLYGMKWINEHDNELLNKSWFFLIDDDTWVNVPLLFKYVARFPPSLPLSFSHIYIMYNHQAVYNGGAGMLFSKSAFRLLATAVLTDACPLTEVDPGFVNNDNILSECAYATGVLKVTSSLFSTYEGVLHLENAIIDTSWLDQITVHKITDRHLAEQMYCSVEKLSGHVLDRSCGMV